MKNVTTSRGCASSQAFTPAMAGSHSVLPSSHSPWHRYGSIGPLGVPVIALRRRRALSTTSEPKSRFASARAVA
jgi:hypothetical protein